MTFSKRIYKEVQQFLWFKGWYITLGQMSNPSLIAWKKADILKINGDDDDKFIYFQLLYNSTYWYIIWLLSKQMNSTLVFVDWKSNELTWSYSRQ